MPLIRFFPLARRLFYYQGALQYLAMEEQEQEQPRGKVQYDTGEEINHNTAAAKAAAKAAGLKEGEPVKVVPLSSFMAMAGGLGEYTQVKSK